MEITHSGCKYYQTKKSETIMKKVERKVLRRKLFIAVKKVLKENQDALQDKTIKAINKSLKYIAKKTDKKTSITSKKIKNPKSKSL